MQSKNRSCELSEPPRLADAFLEWYCASEFLEEVQGDLHEMYRNRVREIGETKANMWYCLDVLRFFRPYLLKT